MPSVCELSIGLNASGSPAQDGISSWNRVAGGPAELLGWLESQLGLTHDPPEPTTRVMRYAELLAQSPGSSYRDSLETDRWSTAVELLRRRDELRLAGWSGAVSEDLPALVRELGVLEPEAGFIAREPHQDRHVRAIIKARLSYRLRLR